MASEHFERTRGDYELTTDPDRIDVAAVHAFLTDSYWARGIDIETVARSIEHSLCFSLQCAGKQVGFARVISDRATYAYLADVYVLEGHRGAGLGQWLVASAIEHPELQDIRLWMLLTKDAHELYRRFGFESARRPERIMERRQAP